MTAQTDVKSLRTVSATPVSLITGRVRVKSVIISAGATAGTVTLSDGSAGAALLVLDTGTASALTSILLPGEGVLFQTGVYYTPGGTAPIGVVVVYG